SPRRSINAQSGKPPILRMAASQRRFSSRHFQETNSTMTDRPSSSSLYLRKIGETDLPILFEQQLDADANRMAAVKPRDWDAYQTMWLKILDDPTVVARAIVVDDGVVGQIGCFRSDDQDCVGYWIDRAEWGRGYASQALKLLLEDLTIRPLHARVATHN